MQIRIGGSDLPGVAEDGHDGPHEQVTDGVLVFRWPDDPYDVADPANPTNWRILPR